ncbi:MAG TPA: hypothetical protein VNQ79_09450 [Blastocatellia bacterium]|nr:hypothetical protein [Blastocatellia bacterium]
MPMIEALQHLFSSVERGFFPQQRRGFQTVAVSEELIGTADLQTLEDAAFYALSRERLAAALFPIKETFYQLPSGRYAVGRTIYLGLDSLGREGNYLTHHLIVSRADLLMAQADPFNLLSALPSNPAETDLTPRTLAPLIVDSNPLPLPARLPEEISPALFAALAKSVIDGQEKTTLLIGDEAKTRRVLQSLFGVLALEERLKLTFSTHFYEAQQQRALFALALVGSHAEAPSQRQQFVIFDAAGGEAPALQSSSAYAEWLSDCLLAGRLAEVRELNESLNALRGGSAVISDQLLSSVQACAALRERAGGSFAATLKGRPRTVKLLLNQLSAPRELADAILAAASPDELCGQAVPETAAECLSALRAAATGKVWSEWVNRWKADSALSALPHKGASWWQKWRRT